MGGVPLLGAPRAGTPPRLLEERGLEGVERGAELRKDPLRLTATGELALELRDLLAVLAVVALLSVAEQLRHLELVAGVADQLVELGLLLLGQRLAAGELLRFVEGRLRPRSDLTTAVEIAEHCVGKGAEGQLLGELERVLIEEAIWQGKTTRLTELCDEAMTLLPRFSAEWYDVLGEAAATAGRMGDTERVARFADQLGSGPSGEAESIGWQIAGSKIALQLFASGRPEPARQLLQSVAAHRRGEMDALVAAHYHFARGLSPEAREDPGMLLIEFQRSADHFEAIGDRRQAALQRSNVGHAKNELGLYDEATNELRAALAEAERLSLALAANGNRQSLAASLYGRGKHAEALALLEVAISGFEAQGDLRMSASCRLDLARVLLSSGRVEAAGDAVLYALEALPESSPLRPRGLAINAHVLKRKGDLGGALRVARQAMELFEECGSVESGEALVRLIYAKALEAVGDEEEAKEAMNRARRSLLERAGKISHQKWRQSFVENIPEHAQTMRLAEKWDKEMGAADSQSLPGIQLCVLCRDLAEIGVLCRKHAAAISQCKQLTKEQISSKKLAWPEAWLVDQWGSPHSVGRKSSIGRSAGESDITVLHPSVSSVHACIERVSDSWQIADLDSLNGTCHGQTRITAATELADGDTIAIGEVQFYFTHTQVAR